MSHIIKFIFSNKKLMCGWVVVEMILLKCDIIISSTIEVERFEVVSFEAFISNIF